MKKERESCGLHASLILTFPSSNVPPRRRPLGSRHIHNASMELANLHSFEKSENVACLGVRSFSLFLPDIMSDPFIHVIIFAFFVALLAKYVIKSVQIFISESILTYLVSLVNRDRQPRREPPRPSSYSRAAKSFAIPQREVIMQPHSAAYKHEIRDDCSICYGEDEWETARRLSFETGYQAGVRYAMRERASKEKMDREEAELIPNEVMKKNMELILKVLSEARHREDLKETASPPGSQGVSQK